MNELLNTYLPPFVTDHIYVPYLFFVIVTVEWMRYQFDGIDAKIKPKYLTALVGLMIAVICYFMERSLENVDITIVKMIVSYFVTTMFYDLVVSPIKEKYFPNFNNKQKQ